MARKTKAELNAEREATLAAAREEEARVYPQRLMAALEEATQKNNYELEVCNGEFVLRDRDVYPARLTLELTYQYNVHSQNLLEGLEFDLVKKAQERAEAARRYTVKQAALAKLTEEEKELLGL